MFIKKLIIESKTKIIRKIEFTEGLNLIIDDTPSDDDRSTGNNVGKTTVLKLIDFCLGAEPNIIFTDTENKKEVYKLVKDFLVENQVTITLILTENFSNSNKRLIEIKRNFLPGKKALREINGKRVLAKDFEIELERIIMPDKTVEKPTFRQLISHNIRYKDLSLNNTLKTLDAYTKDAEYETLYLYLLGCTFDNGAKKQALITKLNQEISFKERLEKDQTKTTYEMSLDILKTEIKDLEDKQKSFKPNEKLEEDLEQLNIVKCDINKTSSLISNLKIRKNLIECSMNELNNSISKIDVQQLRILYSEVTSNISGIQKTFEDLVHYHNSMVGEKMKYISKDLPQLEENINSAKVELEGLLAQEKELNKRVSKCSSLEKLEKIMEELNEKYRKKGEYESVINQLEVVEKNIANISEQISAIDYALFSGEFESILKDKVKKFNKYFASISQKLYGEKYALTYKKDINKKGQQYYKFNAFNANMSTGKKQGEILCFDLAYLLFAKEENINCLNFLLNDKKELMHDNQLIKVAEFVQNKKIQLVISILKDKLPMEVLAKSHIAVELSQNDKLFRIENTH